jgi:hypothetical protein
MVSVWPRAARLGLARARLRSPRGDDGPRGALPNRLGQRPVPNLPSRVLIPACSAHTWTHAADRGTSITHHNSPSPPAPAATAVTASPTTHRPRHEGRNTALPQHTGQLGTTLGHMQQDVPSHNPNTNTPRPPACAARAKLCPCPYPPSNRPFHLANIHAGCARPHTTNTKNHHDMHICSMAPQPSALGAALLDAEAELASRGKQRGQKREACSS